MGKPRVWTNRKTNQGLDLGVYIPQVDLVVNLRPKGVDLGQYNRLTWGKPATIM